MLNTRTRTGTLTHTRTHFALFGLRQVICFLRTFKFVKPIGSTLNSNTELFKHLLWNLLNIYICGRYLMQADTRGARNERHVDTERGHTRQGPTFFLSFFFFCCCCCCCVIMCGPKQTTSPNEIQTRTEKHSKIHQLCVCLLWQYVR